MGIIKVTVLPGLLFGVQREIQSAIKLICENDSLSAEDTQAIRILTNAIDHIRVDNNFTVPFDKERFGLCQEDNSKYEKNPQDR